MQRRFLLLLSLIAAAVLIAFSAASQAPPPLPATVQGEVSIYCQWEGAYRPAPAGVPVYAYSPDGTLLSETATGKDSPSPSGYFLVIEDYEGTVHLYVGDVYAGSVSVQSGGIYQANLSIKDDAPPSKPGDPTVSPLYSATPFIEWKASTDNVFVEYYEVTIETVDGLLVGRWKVTSTGFQVTEPLQDGYYTVRVKPIDAACQPGEESWTDFIVDTNPPEIVSAYPEPDSVVPGPDVILEFVVRDVTPKLTVELYIDYVLVAPEILKARDGWIVKYATVLEDGIHNVYMVLTDDAGYRTVAEYSFRSDSTFPRIEVLEAPPRWTNQADVNFLFRVYDPNGSSVSVSVFLEGSEVPYEWIGEETISVSLVNLSEGSYTLEVRAVDDAGLESKLTYDFGVDMTPPHAELRVPKATGEETVCIEAIAGDILSGVDWTTAVFTVNGVDLPPDYVGDGVAGVCVELPEGVVDVSFRVVDAAGNSTIVEDHFIVDRTPPEIVLPGDVVATQTGTAEIIIEASDNLSGVSSLTVYLDGEPVLEASYDGDPVVNEEITLNLPEGVYSVEVVVVDSAGNASSAELTLVSDSTPPSISILEPEPDSIVPGPAVIVRVQVSDEESWIKWETLTISVNGAPVGYSYSPDTGVIEAALQLAPGIYTVKLSVADAAGNTAEASWSFTVDPETANIIFNPPSGSVLKGEILVVDINVHDEGGLREVTVYVDGEAVASCSCEGETSWSYTLDLNLPEGEHVVEVRVVESSGRLTTARAIYTLDATPPRIIALDEQPLVSPAEKIELLFNVTDEVGLIRESVEVKVNGVDVEARYDWTEPGKLLVTLVLPEGIHQVEVAVSDLAGNRAIATVEVVVDTSPPSIVSAYPGDGEVVDSTNGLVVKLVLQEEISWLSQVRVYINGEEVPHDIVEDDGHIYMVRVDVGSLFGKIHLRIEAFDAAGNKFSAEYTFYADSHPPTLKLITDLNEAEGLLVHDGDHLIVRYIATDVDTWIDVISVTVNGDEASYVYEGDTVIISLDGEGVYHVQVRIVDASGKEAVAEHIIVLDATQPQTAGPEVNILIITEKEAVEVVVSDASGVPPSIQVDSGGPLSVSYEVLESDRPGELVVRVSIQARDSGLGEVRVTAKDLAGRVSVYQVPVLVDLEPPRLSAPPVAADPTGDVIVEVSVSDDTLPYHEVGGYAITVTQGEVVEVDHATGKITIKVTAGFEARKVEIEYVDPAGRSAATSFYVVRASPITVEIKLEKGLNLVGIPAGTTMQAVEEGLAECGASVTGLVSPGGTWSVVEEIDEVIEWAALWVESPIPCYVVVQGYSVDGEIVNFWSGGYGLVIPEEPVTPEEVAAMAGAPIIVYGWNSDNQSWRLTYSYPDHAVGRIKVLSPGKAYLAYKVGAQGELAVSNDSPRQVIVWAFAAITITAATGAVRRRDLKRLGTALLLLILAAGLANAALAQALSAMITETPGEEVQAGDEGVASLTFAGIIEGSEQSAIILELVVPRDGVELSDIDLKVNGVPQNYTLRSVGERMLLIADDVSPANGMVELDVKLAMSGDAERATVKWRFILQAFHGINVLPPVEEAGETVIIAEKSPLEAIAALASGYSTLIALAGGALLGSLVALALSKRGRQ